MVSSANIMDHQERADRARCRELFCQLQEFRQFRVFEHDSYLMELEYSPDSDLEKMQVMVDWYKERLESIKCRERMKRVCEIMMAGCAILEHLMTPEPATESKDPLTESKEPPTESKDPEI